MKIFNWVMSQKYYITYNNKNPVFFIFVQIIHEIKCINQMSASSFGAPLGELSRPCVVTEGFIKSLMKPYFNPSVSLRSTPPLQGRQGKSAEKLRHDVGHRALRICSFIEPRRRVRCQHRTVEVSVLFIFIPTTVSGPPPLKSFKGRLKRTKILLFYFKSAKTNQASP